ncbi:hypothetical protein [Yoonia sp. BS5-3]|uniref:Uncharacterized protein n=1 Tax=Yoonia phaeophyticola TaxID=3137369 RepID=A0ABZ2V240_9RHOB
MAQSYVDKVADELADLALADQEATGDIGVVDMIGDVLGASSQTLQETYLTAVRVRRAEARARAILAERAGNAKVPLAELIEDDDETLDEALADVEEAQTADDDTPPAAETPALPAANAPKRITR